MGFLHHRLRLWHRTQFRRRVSDRSVTFGPSCSSVTVCDNVLSQMVQEPLRTHTSAADHLWFVVYHWRLQLEWCLLFFWDPTCFLKKLRLGLYFTLVTVYWVLMCDNVISQTVPESLRTRSSAANHLRSAVYHRLFCYDWHTLSDVDCTHSFSWTVCGAIARLKQNHPILNRHAKNKFATIFN